MGKAKSYKEPSMYKVIMHNDDYTPVEFVEMVLELFFNMEEMIVTKILDEIRKTGKAICGIYTKDIAETKVGLVTDHARMHEHPLLCSLEAS
jgi:ATP-dependent Clp protease adaptor protein ClpS